VTRTTIEEPETAEPGHRRGEREGGVRGGMILTEEVSHKGESADEDTPELSGDGDVSIQLVLQSGVSVSFDDLHRPVTVRGRERERRERRTMSCSRRSLAIVLALRPETSTQILAKVADMERRSTP
jgi:hypothetical protein